MMPGEEDCGLEDERGAADDETCYGQVAFEERLNHNTKIIINFAN